MTNPVRGEVKLGEHTLRLTSQGFCAAEEATGINIPVQATLDEIAGGMSMRLVHALIFGGMVSGNPDFTSHDAHALIDELGVNACAAAARMALLRALPAERPPGKAKRQPKASPASTG